MIRLAALGDCHFYTGSKGELAPHLGRLKYEADMLLIAGDLTRQGKLDENQVLCDELQNCPVPVIATFGNHDYQSDLQNEMAEQLRAAGVIVLERQSAVITVGGASVGIVGAKGFGGGFLGATGSDFGEPEMKSFIRHTKAISDDIRRMLTELTTPYKIALLHYSPVAETLMGERKEIYPFLGSYHLAEAIDDGGADIVFHGHAHRGTEKGSTSGGVPVRNVAQSVLGRVYAIYTLDKEGVRQGTTAAAAA